MPWSPRWKGKGLRWALRPAERRVIVVVEWDRVELVVKAIRQKQKRTHSNSNSSGRRNQITQHQTLRTTANENTNEETGHRGQTEKQKDRTGLHILCIEVWVRIPLSRRSVSNSLLGKKKDIFQIIPDYIRPGLTLDQSGTHIILKTTQTPRHTEHRTRPNDNRKTTQTQQHRHNETNMTVAGRSRGAI